MNNSPNNESQEKQTQRAAGHEAESAQTGGGASDSSLKHAGPLGETDVTQTDVTRRAIDVLNDDTLDDTVEADGKNRDASHDEALLEHNPNAFIGVNATLVNSHFEQGDGLGGFDSRPARSGLALALEEGFSVVDKGMVAPDVEEVERQYEFVERDPRGYSLRGRRHFAINHVRPSRLIEIQRREK